MKRLLTLCFVFVIVTNAFTQTAITAVTTSTSAAPSSTTYSNAGITYNWGLAPNNSRTLVNGFTAGGLNYTYASFLTGNVRVRRVNNAGTSGNYTLVWAEAVSVATTYNMLPEYQNDLEPFFNGRVYNKGTDNFFDNTSANSNNIERLDWIIPGSYSSSTPSRVGFAVFERGAVGAHDPFCIAAITSLDGLGNPASYGNIVRVATANYGDPGPNITYRILKAQNPSNLLDAGTGTQGRGGVIISLQSLGISAGQTIYGYSLFSNDLPVGATPANLVNFNNTTFFPTNTGNPGGIDLIAVTGIYIENTVLPARFLSFNAVENNNRVTLKWDVENESTVSHYELERSIDGRNFTTIHTIQKNATSSGLSTYTAADDLTLVNTNPILYRIKQTDLDGKNYYSNIISVKRNNKYSALTVYPNPATDHLSINISSQGNDRIRIYVLNAAGARVIAEDVKLAIGNNSLTLSNIKNLSAGFYQLSAHWPDGKIIKQQFIKN